MNLSFDNTPQKNNEPPVLTQEEFDTFWKGRRKAIHPKNFLWILLGEMLATIFFSILYSSSGQSNSFAIFFGSILLMAFFFHIPYSLVSTGLWKLFLKKNFPQGMSIKEAISLRATSRKMIKSGSTLPFAPSSSSHAETKAQRETVQQPKVQSAPQPVETFQSQQAHSIPDTEVVMSRRQRREAHQKTSPFGGLKDKAAGLGNLLPTPSQSSVSHYGLPMQGRNEELARLNDMDPFH